MFAQPNRPVTAVPQSFPPTSFQTLQLLHTALITQNGGVYWPVDAPVNQPYIRAIHSGLVKGRQLFIDSTMEFADATKWTADTNSALTKVAGTRTGGSGSLILHIQNTLAGSSFPGAHQGVAIPGQWYEVDGWVRSDGSAVPRVTNNTIAYWQGTNSTSWQHFTTWVLGDSSLNIFLSSQDTALGQYVEYDDVTCKLVNIPASTDVPVNLLSDADGEGSVGAWTAVNSGIVTHQSGSAWQGTNVIRITNGGVALGGMKQNVCVVGQQYRLWGFARCVATGGLRQPLIKNGTQTVFLGSNGNALWQYFETTFTALDVDLTFLVQVGTTSANEFDSLFLSIDKGIRQDANTLPDGAMEWPTLDFYGGSNGATLTKDASAPHSGTLNLRIKRTTITGAQALFGGTTAGKTYYMELWYKSDGTGVVRFTNGSLSPFTSTTATSWTKATFIFVAQSTINSLNLTNASGTPLVDVDDIILIEISPLVAIPVNGLIFGNVETSRLGISGQADGINDLLNYHTHHMNSIWTPAAFTISFFFKPTAGSFWTDGVQHFLYGLQGGGSLDQVLIFKPSTNNTLGFTWRGTNAAKQVTITLTSPSAGWHHVALSLSIANDQMICYFDGVQVGSTQTGLTPWTPVGNNLVTTTQVFAAANTAGGSPAPISLSHLAIITAAIDPGYIMELTKLGDVT